MLLECCVQSRTHAFTPLSGAETLLQTVHQRRASQSRGLPRSEPTPSQETSVTLPQLRAHSECDSSHQPLICLQRLPSTKPLASSWLLLTPPCLPSPPLQLSFSVGKWFPSDVSERPCQAALCNHRGPLPADTVQSDRSGSVRVRAHVITVTTSGCFCIFRLCAVSGVGLFFLCRGKVRMRPWRIN